MVIAMENMNYFFTDKSGRAWYICKDCGHKEMWKPVFCPVCKNKYRCTNQDKKQVIDMLINNAKR